MKFTLTSDTTSRSAILHIAGDLDYTTTSELVAAAEKLLADQPALRNLHLDCAQMTLCDSAGVSGFLTIHQRTAAAGVHLHLDRRPTFLDRILDITGILEHLTAAPSARAGRGADSREMADESGAV
jgi:anti-anti-sigma factor